MDHRPFVTYHLPPLSAPQPTIFPPMDIDLPDRAPSATSSERSTLSPPGSPQLQPAKAPARYDQLGLLDEDHATLERRALLAMYPVQRSFPHKVAQGVMSDGRWTVEHPFVQAFLRNPTGRPTVSYKPAMAIYALAALSVMWRPAHPAYEAFWNQEDKRATAEFIDSVVHMKDSPVDTYPYSWLGSAEMVWQLTGIQKDYAKTRARELGISPQTSSRKMTLRKRKVVQNVPAVEPTPDIADELEPPRKRARKSKPTPKAAAAAEAAAAAAAAANEDGAATSVSADTVAPSAPDFSNNNNTLATPSPLTEPSPLQSGLSAADDQEVKRTTSRSRKSAKKDPAAPAASSRGSARRGSHERSPSTSGSSTAMSSLAAELTRGRSSSSASDNTVIEPIPVLESKAKGKGKAFDIADLAEAASKVESASVEPEDAPVHATRARTRAAAKRGTAEPETTSASPAPEAPAKAAKSSPRKRLAATPDTVNVETVAEAEDQDEPVSVPKKRRRAPVGSRARSGRRR